MGEILGLGMSHYPGFIYPDADMVMRVKDTLRSHKIPPELKQPESWPAPMREEWGNDEGASFAKRHREAFVKAARRLRTALDDFKPDLVVIFGDDQYENFHEDIVPPFCVYISESFDTRPFLKGRGRDNPPPNVWGEPQDKLFAIPGHAQAGRYLARNLLDAGFDIPYAYKMLHHEGLGHAFIRVMLYLDYDRQGWDYPIVPFHVNAYGSNLVRSRGGSQHLFAEEAQEIDPPAPSPKRAFELGRAIAGIFRESPWRVALVGSSSWSHAFLTEKNHWLYPDVPSDRQRFKELQAGDYLAWRDLSVEAVEDAGQHEWLNWVPLIGAMYQLEQRPEYCELIESYLMNSSKCMALFPAGARG
jgi:hypothetical protein